MSITGHLQNSVVVSRVFIVSNISVLNLITIFSLFTQILIYMIKTILKCEYESLLPQDLPFKTKFVAKIPN